MITLTRYSLSRLRAGLSASRADFKHYIINETFINGRPFTFEDHFYQEHLVELFESQASNPLTISKPGQIGATEIFHRAILAENDLVPGNSTVLIMPTHKFAGEVAQTRFNPIISSSPKLRQSINRKVDSTTVKQFHNNSIVYFLGASEQSKGSVIINRPIRRIVADEYDRCSTSVVSSMTSRQAHQTTKPVNYFSTPTVPDYGVDSHREGAQLHELHLRCDHCGHVFWPEYLEHCRIPGFDRPLDTLVQRDVELLNLDLDKTALYCPKCDRIPLLHDKENRLWVIQYPERSHVFVSLSPFDSPKYVSPPDIAKACLKYEDRNEWYNQSLALPVKLADASIDTSQIKFERQEPPVDAVNVLGLDMGRYCHAFVAAVTFNALFIHHAEVIPLQDIRTRLAWLMSNFSIRSAVMDALPYSDLSMEFTAQYSQLWSAVYRVPQQPQPELYRLKTFAEDDSLAGEAINTRQVEINKNKFMDHYVTQLMTPDVIVFRENEYQAEILHHFTAMRRVREYGFEEDRYKWETARQGNHKKPDHFFHTGVYNFMASRIISADTTTLPLGGLVRGFKLKTPV